MDEVTPGAAEPDALRVEHVAKRFGALTALSDVNLRLRRGEVLGLIGDNGAGKSTLIKTLCGFHRPTSGQLFVDGEERYEEDLTDADLSRWSRDYPLLVGNEATRDRPFRGEVYLVAVYDRALSALRDGGASPELRRLEVLL